jgi:hypothetical protein
MEDGLCGNAVVEAGEACDTYVDPAVVAGCEQALAHGVEGHCDLKCGAPNSTQACRVIPASDDTCAATHTLGSDGICRAPTAVFQPTPAQRFEEGGQALTVGNFDEDAASELLITDATTASNFVLGLETPLFGGAPLPSTGLPAVGPISGKRCSASSGSCDATDDLVVPFSVAIGSFLGGASGLQPKIYTSMVLDGDELGPASVPYPVAPIPGALQVGYFDFEASEILLYIVQEATTAVELVATFPISGAVVGDPLFVDLMPEAGTPVPEMAVVTKTGDQLSLRIATLPRPGEMPKTLVPEVVPLGSAGETSGPHPLKRDDRVGLGLVVGPGPFEVVVVDSVDYLTVRRDPLLATLTSEPLAMGYLNEDDAADVVLAKDIAVSLPGTGSPAEYISVFNVGQPYEASLVTDMNRDGLPDIVLTKPSAVDVLLGTDGYTFLPRPHAVDGEPSSPLVADLDGDGTDDVIVSLRPATGPTDDCGDQMLVMLASAEGAFDRLPIELGTIRGTPRMGPVNISFGLAQDAVADVGIMTYCEDKVRVGVMLGSTSGLVSPFLLPATVQVEDPSKSLGVLALGVALGDFGTIAEPAANGQNDMAVLIAPLEDGSNQVRLELHLYEGLGDGDFDGQQLGRPGRQLDELGDAEVEGTDFTSLAAVATLIPAMAAGDVFSTPGDELVLYGPRLDDATRTVLLVFAAGDVTVSRELPDPAPGSFLPRIKLLDVDADGDLDLLATRVGILPGAKLYWYENDGDTFADPVQLPMLDGEILVDFAALRPMWTADGAVTPLLRTGTVGHNICRWPAGAEGSSVLCALAPTVPTTQRLLNLAAAVADVDQDGLEDIVASRWYTDGETETLVFRQCPTSELPACGALP